MRVLVIGGGGREHALCWKLKQSPRCEALYCAPGNGGIAELAELVSVDDLATWAESNRIDLTVVGPDDPLAAGIVDRFQGRGLRIFGPTRDAAQIEWSKAWAKQLLVENGVPTAWSATFDQAFAAHAYVDAQRGPVVVKADGLALGKGVFVCDSVTEAHAAIDALMRDHALGAAGSRVVVEERLVGREVSVIAVCDGNTYRLLPTACDHKAAFDGDRGPNTGGMGAYSPAVWLDPVVADDIEQRALAPVFAALSRIGRRFTGFLYCGVMVTAAGPRVLEFNARMGDPEAQALLPRLDFDLLDLINLAVEGRLDETPDPLPIRSEASCCVVIASRDYPASSPTGFAINGLDEVDGDALVFHAGTRRDAGRLVTSGGRVLSVTALAPSLDTAREHAYANAATIAFDGARYRRDIGAGASVPAGVA